MLCSQRFFLLASVFFFRFQQYASSYYSRSCGYSCACDCGYSSGGNNWRIKVVSALSW